MQKKLIALAVAGLVAAPAFAQSNVTIYGILDAGVAYGKAGDAKYTGLVNGVYNGNRIGFKGSEDLGNGLKAVFALEQGFSIGDGSPNSTKQFHRQSWAGLQGGFGTVALGRQYAPGYSYTAVFATAVGAGAFEPQSILSAQGGMTITPNTPARWDNAITYKTGDMGGFAAEAIYSFNTVQSDTGVAGAAERSDDDMAGLAAKYAAGPLGVGVVYHRLKGAEEDINEYMVAGSYDLGAAKLYASWQKLDRDEDDATAAVEELDRSLASIGAAVPLGMGELQVAYGRLTDDVVDEGDSSSFTLAYQHMLSKRTKVYVAANRTTNDDNANKGVLVRAAGEGSTAVTAGLNHKF